MRKSTPRSKSGCPTCRIRRVKCDETRPSCMRCTKTGRKCDGYLDAAIDAGTPATVAISAAKQAAKLVTLTSYSIPFRIPGSQRDRQLLHYFCVHGSSQLSGFVKHEFWSRTALLACQDEHIVRQSLLALSSLHLDLSYGDGSGAAGKETLSRYGKALRALQTRINAADMTAVGASSNTTRTALVCCILFHCFEVSIGDSEAAMRHLSNGLGLLTAHHNDETGDDELVRSSRDTLSRLDMQATFFDDGRTPSLDLISMKASPYQDSDSNTVDATHSLEHAQRSLIQLQNWQFRFLLANAGYHDQPEECIPPEVLYEKQSLLECFLDWAEHYGPYSSLSTARKPDTADEAMARRALQIQYEALLMLLDSRVPARSEVFGAVPNIAAMHIVQLCESIMRPKSSGDPALPTSPPCAATTRTILSSEAGPVSVLFMLAMKCSDQQVVSKAVELMTVYPRRESLYDSRIVAAMIRRLVVVKAQRRMAAKEGQYVKCMDDSLEYWCEDLITFAEEDVEAAGAGAIQSVYLLLRETYPW